MQTVRLLKSAALRLLFVWTFIIINVTMPSTGALSEYSTLLPWYSVHIPHSVYRTCNASPAVCASGDEKGTLEIYSRICRRLSDPEDKYLVSAAHT